MEDEVRRLLEARQYDAALERLLDLHEKRVFRMALMMLGGDAGRAEEVTQDVFLKLWRALPGYDGRASPSTWLYAIARNTCLTAARAESYGGPHRSRRRRNHGRGAPRRRPSPCGNAWPRYRTSSATS